MDSDGTMQLQESFTFSDDRELFIAEHLRSTKILEIIIFVICKALLKFMKTLSHRNLEPYGIN